MENGISKKDSFPAIVIACVLSISLGLIVLLNALVRKQLFFVNQWDLGYDYRDFYLGSLAFLEGGSPYIVPRYVTTPIPAIANVPLTWFDFSIAARIVILLVLLTTLLAYALMNRELFSEKKTEYMLISVCGLMVVVSSYPFYFLFDRGNIDSFVVLCLCLGLVLRKRSEVLSGLSLALAISAKLYPALIVIPLVVGKRWRLLFWLAAFQMIFFLLAPTLWLDFFNERLLTREDWFRTDENGSIANTFFYFGRMLEMLFRGMNVELSLVDVFIDASIYVYAALLGGMIYADLRAAKENADADFLVRAAMYFPFMVAVPKLAYHYELIILLMLIPVVCQLWARKTGKVGRAILWIIIIGIILSQFQAVALEMLIDSRFPHFVPGFGLFLVMVGCTTYKLYERLHQRSIEGQAVDP